MIPRQLRFRCPCICGMGWNLGLAHRPVPSSCLCGTCNGICFPCICGIGDWNLGLAHRQFHLPAYAALAMESASLENCLLHEVLRKLLLLEPRANSKISPSSTSKVFNKCLLFGSFVQFALPNTGLRPARGVRERCETFAASEPK